MSETDKKNKIISKRFSEFFKVVGLTQEEFAKRIRVARSNISSWQSGVHGISGAAITAMEHEFNLNPVWLFTGEGEMFIPQTEAQDWADLEADWERGNQMHENPKLKKLTEMLFEIEEADYSVVEELLKRFQKRKL
ncbi:helix-turn-helix domain-containing protein [Leptospira interrogans serovar Icterohaemorrhagiae]|uniref:helix-turn-helix domain-containing protein n=1 Tax=Leptospira interrogans TaxID=173 RepID=UPI00046C880A|nr:helix-turn-helix domain-containing protein [Leptospira interrogans]QOI33599.1 helix-turn-helix domain-containing protein [Leptospira interrogans serovar Icterohaemorrhagiae]